MIMASTHMTACQNHYVGDSGLISEGLAEMILEIWAVLTGLLTKVLVTSLR